MAAYGDTPEVTRLAGKGNGGNFLDLTADSRTEVEAAYAAGSNPTKVTYQAGAGPVRVAVVNPRDVVDGDYEITFQDNNPADNAYVGPVTWTLRCLDNCGVGPIVSERPISEANEQIIAQYGIAVDIADVNEPGSDPFGQNGALGAA
ncbi:MAG: hypothetical protein HC821_00600 [Lewinella sp.]|nr:hypothetical protein [Lewinella sp.]